MQSSKNYYLAHPFVLHSGHSTLVMPSPFSMVETYLHWGHCTLIFSPIDCPSVSFSLPYRKILLLRCLDKNNLNSPLKNTAKQASIMIANTIVTNPRYNGSEIRFSSSFCSWPHPESVFVSESYSWSHSPSPSLSIKYFLPSCPTSVS